MILNNYIKSVFVNIKNYWYYKDSTYVENDISYAAQAGIEHIIISGVDWSVTAEKNAVDTYVSLIHKKGLTFAISPVHLHFDYDARPTEFNVDDAQHCVDEAVSLSATLAARYDPDTWYLDCEWPAEFPYLKDSSGNYLYAQPGLLGSMQKDMLAAYLSAKDCDIFVSPMYGTYGTIPAEASVRANFTAHMAEISKATLGTTKNLYCAVQDGVGAPYLTPRRTVGSAAFDSLLSMFSIFDSICTTYGWEFCANVELYDLGGYPPTWERVKGQLDAEGSYGIGPCWEYSAHMSPQSPDPYAVPLYNSYCSYRGMTYCRTS